MYVLMNVLILAILVPAGDVERASDGPCRARLEGQRLLTTVELPTGVMVEGPWRVVHTGDVKDGQKQFMMVATLDRVVERDVMTGERRVIPFPEPVNLAFEGTNQQDLVQRAANVWCVTVMRAQENRALDRLAPNRGAVTRITMLADPRSRA